MRYRLGEQEFTEHDVRRLRSLSDLQIGALFTMGRKAEWAVAIGQDPTPIAEPKVVEPRGIDRAQLLDVEKMTDDDGNVRIIEGIATTTRANSHGYALDPLGVKFKLPLPLTLGHDTKRRIGWVVAAEVSSEKIEFTAKLAKRDMYPEVRAAWDRIIRGDLACVSTGCPPGGIGDFRADRCDVDLTAHAWTWHELTVCERGANPDARILLVKELRKFSDPLIWCDRRLAPAGAGIE